ncbi:MAG TPA: MOSC N-terminal beta barrel domain-containing protein [Labilithrix sp.]|nr:MOSC N-terminal beta barrel domain-containing protein [Labilithrix sp.]
MHVASLHIYPVKGARGISLQRSEVLACGLRNDRRFMVVDDSGSFLTQRGHPRLALVDVALAGDRMTLSVAGKTAQVPLAPEGPRRRVRVWNDEVEAIDVGGEAAELFSDHLGQRCSLVFMPLDVIRPVDPKYARAGDHVGFADGFPVLIASLSSLAELNARLARIGAPAVPMNRFRPNVVVEGGEPYEEEQAITARIGPVALRTPKRCSRCAVTTVDQATAEKGIEPLRTLATYRTDAQLTKGYDRSQGKNVYFAMNAIADLGPGESAVIAVGDPVVYAFA